MSLNQFALFLHLTGAGLLFAAMAAETVGLRALHRAATSVEVRQASGAATLTRLVGPLAAALILFPGVYMSLTKWGWPAWIVLGLAGMVVIALLGAANGIALARRVQQTSSSEAAAGRSPDGVRAPRFVISLATRFCLAMGILFLMTAKPGWTEASLTMALAALVAPLTARLLPMVGRGRTAPAASGRASR